MPSRNKIHGNLVLGLQAQTVYRNIFFARIRICPIAQPHPLSKQAHVSLKDIAKYPLYLLSKKSTLNSLVANAFEKENIPYQQGGETSRHKILLDILSNSQNVSILPQALLNAKIYTELCYVPLESPIYSKVAIIRLKNHKYNKMTNTFWNFWRKHCTISEAQNKLEQRKKSLSS